MGHVFGLIFLYWVIRIVFCRPSSMERVFQIFLALVALLFFLALPKAVVWQPLAISALILAFSLKRHLQKHSEPLRLAPLIGWLSLYLVGGVTSLLILAFRFQEEQIIGRVILKGESKPTWMTWKPPTAQGIEGAWIPSYGVEILDAKGKKLFCDLIPGDLVGVRAQVILIDWPYHLLGFEHLYRLELVHNGYATAQRHQFFPHMAHALPFSAQLLETVWKRLFLGSWRMPGIKSSTLESSYFPLHEAREYDLVIGKTGLSAQLHEGS